MDPKVIEKVPLTVDEVSDEMVTEPLVALSWTELPPTGTSAQRDSASVGAK